MGKKCARWGLGQVLFAFLHFLRTHGLGTFWRKITTIITPLLNIHWVWSRLHPGLESPPGSFFSEKPHAPGQVMVFIDHFWQVVCSFEDTEWLTAQKIHHPALAQGWSEADKQMEGFMWALVALEMDPYNKEGHSITSSSRYELIQIS